MWGKKKKGNKDKVRTFVNGQEVAEGEEVTVPKPGDFPSETQAHEPEQVQVHDPSHQPENHQAINVECIICLDFGFYADNINVWHNCPRCNPKSMKKQQKEFIQQLEKRTQEYSTEEQPVPTKGNLYEFRQCPHCMAQNEVHKRKKKWLCENCGQEVTP